MAAIVLASWSGSAGDKMLMGRGDKDRILLDFWPILIFLD